MRQIHHALNILSACSRQQRALAAAVEAAAAAVEPGGSLPHSHTRWLSSTAAARQSAAGDLPDQGDSYYWAPPTEEHAFTLDRRSIFERRATGKLEAALEAVLLSDGFLREHLVDKYGFSIHRVRFAKDRRKVFILWDANTGKAEACQRALDKTAYRLRSDLARVLKSKHTPYLEFRHDHLPPLQAATAAAMEAVQQEVSAAPAAAGQQAATAAAAMHQQQHLGQAAGVANAEPAGDRSSSCDAAGSTAAAWDGDAADVPAAGSAGDGSVDVDAAIARLQAITRQRRWPAS